jgi:hypothetical protein
MYHSSFTFHPSTKSKKNSSKKKNKNNSCICNSIAHIIMPSFETYLITINQMKSLKLLPKAWKLSPQQTKNQNQSNEKFEIVAKNLKIVSITN